MAALEQATGFAEMAKFARVYLFHLYGVPSGRLHNLPDGQFSRVNVTLRVRGIVRGSMAGRGYSLEEQLCDAVSRAALDTRFTCPIVKADLSNITVEVWLQTSSELIPLELREQENAIRFGVDGVEVEQKENIAYYKPSVSLTSKYRTSAELFSALCKKAKLPVDSWKSSDCALRKTSWIHISETTRHGSIEMEALRSTKEQAVSRDCMIEWACSGANYLLRNQYADGSFCYRYRPFLNTAAKGRINPVRASGCAYAIAQAASHLQSFGTDEMQSCARKAVNSILRRSAPLGNGGGFIADQQRDLGSGKLGTSALLLLALLVPPLRGEYQEEIERLALGIRSAQAESGTFDCVFGKGEHSSSQVNFFPGQAILACVLKAEFGDQLCREAYRRAFHPYREHFRRNPATAFVGWHADAWSRAAVLESNSEYAQFVFEQIDWLLQFQMPLDAGRFEAGGFSWNGTPPCYSSIVYTEAIARGADLAYRLGDKKWMGYKRAFTEGMKFCSQLRLTEDQSSFFPDPERAIGGVATSISDFSVRSDVVQHMITLALCAHDRPMLFD